MKIMKPINYSLIAALLLISTTGSVDVIADTPNFLQSDDTTAVPSSMDNPVIQPKLKTSKSIPIESLHEDFDANRYEFQGLVEINPLEIAENDRISIKLPVNTLNNKIEQFSLHREQSTHGSIQNYGGSISPEIDGYSRISIDKLTGSIIGTFLLDGEIYRIMSNSDGSQNYMLKSKNKDFDNKSFIRSPSLRNRNFELHRIHEQKLMRDKIGPRFISSKESEFHAALSLMRGNIGKVEANLLVERGDSYVREIVDSFSPFLRLSGAEEFEIYDIEGDPEIDDYFLIEFRQVSQNIPVNELNRIEVHSKSGKIHSLSVKIYDSARIQRNRESWITQNDARAIAYKALGISADEQEVEAFYGTPDLYFEPVSKKSLHPYWKFISRPGLQHLEAPKEIIIDAITGEYIVNDAGLNGNSETTTRVCATDYGSPIECPILTTDDGSHSVAYEINDDGIADIGWSETPSNPGKYSGPFWTINDAETNWDYVDSTVCCAQGRVAVILDSPAGDPGYYPSADTIVFPPKDTASSAYIKNGVEYSSNKELVVHERAHRLMTKKNPDFSKSIVSGKSNIFLRSMGEGLADVLAATTGGGYTWKSDWVFGDNLAHNPRDARISRKISDYNGASSAHTNATVFSNFFYRVSLKDGISSKLVLHLALRVIYHISDSDSDGYNWDDFWEALEASTSHINNTSLTEAVSKVWSEMDPQGTTAPTVPIPPPSVLGSFSYCSGERTYGHIEWTDVAPSYAVYFKVRSSGSLGFDEITPLNYGTVYTSYDVEWKIKSCNGGICGPLSTDSYIQFDECGLGGGKQE